MPTFRTPFADMYIAFVLLNGGMAKQTVGRRLAYRGSLRPKLFVWLLYHKKMLSGHIIFTRYSTPSQITLRLTL